LEALESGEKNAGVDFRVLLQPIGGAIASIPVVATGLLAWRFQLEGAHLKGNLLLHLMFGGLASLLMWSVVALYQKSSSQWVRVRYGVQAVTAIVISITGHLGGFVSV